MKYYPGNKIVYKESFNLFHSLLEMRFDNLELLFEKTKGTEISSNVRENILKLLIYEKLLFVNFNNYNESI